MNFGYKILKSSINKYFWSHLKSAILIYHILVRIIGMKRNASPADYNWNEKIDIWSRCSDQETGLILKDYALSSVETTLVFW